MSRNIPLDARILISSSESYVLDSPIPSRAGSDGGVWIAPLIHRNSIFAVNQTDFETQKTLEDLCKDSITHIYIGGRNNSFDPMLLQNRPAWYELLLLLPNAQVYKIVGCH
jgi:hypothetical protein